MRDLLITGLCLGLLIGAVFYFDSQRQLAQEPIDELIIAEDFIFAAPSFQNGGDNLTFVEERACDDNCRLFIFSYVDASEQFGNQSELTNSTIERKIAVVVQEQEVISGVIDDEWNMITKQEVTQEERQSGSVFCILPGCLDM